MTATDFEIDTSLAEDLLASLRPPCIRGEHHAHGCFGCEPDAPAKWVCLLLHAEPSTCDPTPVPLCDGFVRHRQHMIAENLGHPFACARCGVETRDLGEWFVVIGEV